MNVSRTTQHLPHIDSFRAVAIFFVVLGHCTLEQGRPQGSLTLEILQDLFENSSILFVFTAGLLFHHLSAKYHYPDYLARKWRTVMLPYLFVSLPAIALAVAGLYPREHYAPADWPVPAQALWHLAKGGAHVNFPLWYIPVIALFFLAAPLLMLFARRPALYVLILPLSVLAILLHRPPHPNLDTLRLVVYVLPAYLLGMACSQFAQQAPRWLDEKPALLGVLLLLVLALPVLVDPHSGNYIAQAWFSADDGLVDWLWIQKLLAGPLMFWWLRHLPARLHHSLSPWAHASFGIFFVHAYWLVLLAWVWARLGLHGNLFTALGLGLAVLLGSFLSVRLLHRLLPRYSLMLVGYKGDPIKAASSPA